MNYSKDEFTQLQRRIAELEHENRLIKERLEEAGISYADIVSDHPTELNEAYDADQGARIQRFEVTDKVAYSFFMMFCRGRKDVYDLRYTNPKTGRTGNYTQCSNFWKRERNAGMVRKWYNNVYM